MVHVSLTSSFRGLGHQLRTVPGATDNSRKQPRIMPAGRRLPSKKAAKTGVLDVDSLHRVLHMARRCRVRKIHTWLWPQEYLAVTIMTSVRLGVTGRYCDQFAHRVF